PAELPEAEAFFDRPEVETALALLSVIDNPRDDIALIAALRSPAYAFTPGELAEIRLSRPDGDFYDALVLYAGSDEKSRRFLTELEDFRALAPELGAERTLWLLYNRTELPALVSAETVSGAERRAGLMRLIEYARGAAATGRVSLFDFLRFVRKLREHNAGTDAASSSYGGTGAVRIMTAHKSKGLEFPIVFLADMSRQFNFTDSREKLLFHRELGVGPKRVDLERRIEYPTLPRLAIARKLADETMSEELRVLYVAMTRAQEKLIITYASGGAEDTLAKLAPHVRQFDASRFNASQVGARIPPYILSKQKSVGDILLLSALARPEARAMFDEQSRSVTEVARYGRPGVARNFDWDMRLIRVGKENVFSARGESTASLSPEKELPAPPSEQQPPPALVYPYPKAPELPSKLTVTELKNRRVDLEARADALPIEATRENEHKTPHARPDFITQSSALTGAERGTALHLAMRRLDFREYAGEEEVRRELDSLAATGYLSARRREAVDEAKILRFLRSTLGARVISSGQKSPELFREFKFSVFVPAEMYFPGGGKDEIMLQGVVDLAFREAEPNGGDGLVIVDFKTDRIAGLAALREKTTLYTPQIEAYMSAMERVTGLRAHEGILYFFDADEAVRV
ncbi:MAG: PD-(D/E)XK nuclease family protein, partial [Oscillospiraceae bacterium]|nr:PD-(D/E)XK nuclease family protein [Oscillospiraceae bacterium]